MDSGGVKTVSKERLKADLIGASAANLVKALIPAFYDEDDETYLDTEVIQKIAEKVAEHGTQLWFEWSVKKFSRT